MANPFKGDGWEFDPKFVIDLDVGIHKKFYAEINTHISKLEALQDEIEQFADSAKTKDVIVFNALYEVISTRAKGFVNVIKETEKFIKDNLNVDTNLHVRNLDISWIWPGDKRSKIRRIRDLVAAQRKVIKGIKGFRIPKVEGAE